MVIDLSLLLCSKDKKKGFNRELNTLKLTNQPILQKDTSNRSQE